MSFSEDLIQHALKLLPDGQKQSVSDVDLRRAVSAAYYALFHQLCSDSALLLAPHVPESVRNRIQRWFNHGEMKRVCERFSKPVLDQPLRDLVGDSAPQDLRFVAEEFIALQESRHLADYDLGYSFAWNEARLAIEVSVRALKAWQRTVSSAEANIFMLSLLVWKNWEKDR